MADKRQKFKENIPGKYYVSEECIGCLLCAEISPGNFGINSDEDLPAEHAYVCRQPDNEKEEHLCAETKETCPANAIGDDGM